MPIEALSPYLTIKNAAQAIEFYEKAFAAVVDMKLLDPGDGRIGHAELIFGANKVFISDEYPDFGALGPEAIGGSPIKLHLQVDDADAFVAKAVAAGATLLRSVKDEFHGHRSGMVEDPFGFSWFIASKTEDVSAAEMQRRWDQMTA